MSISEKLSQAPAKKVTCKTCNWISTQSESDKAAIQGAIDNPAWSIEALVRVLQEDGLTAGVSAFRAHVVQGH
jgi:flavin-binding protein dodecin